MVADVIVDPNDSRRDRIACRIGKAKEKESIKSNQINRVSAWNSSNTKGSRSLFFFL